MSSILVYPGKTPMLSRVPDGIEPGVASFGLDGVVTGLGLSVFGAEFAQLEAPRRLDAVRELLSRYRVLLVWDNFESVREMPDPAGATPALDAAGCAALRGFLA
jgi:hypothetical protein